MDIEREYFLIATDGDIYRKFAFVRYNRKRPELVFGGIPSEDSNGTPHHRTYHSDGLLHSKIPQSGASGKTVRIYREPGQHLHRFSGFGKLNKFPIILEKENVEQIGQPISKKDIDDGDIIINPHRAKKRLQVFPFLMSPDYPIENIISLLPVDYDLRIEGLRIHQYPWIGVLSVPEPRPEFQPNAMFAHHYIPSVPTEGRISDENLPSE